MERPRHLQVLKRLFSVLCDKFDRVVVHYPASGDLWSSMITESGTAQSLLLLREDYRLYYMVIPAGYPLSIQEIFSELEREL